MPPGSGPKICIAVILVGSLTWSGLAWGQPTSFARKPLRRAVTEVCWVDRWRPAECIPIAKLRQLLSKDDVEKLLANLDRVLEQGGISAGHDALVECGSAARAVVTRIAPKTEPPRRAPALGTGDVKRLSGRISGCAARVASFAGGPERAGERQQQWIDNTTAQVDAELAGCRDSGDSRIAQDSTERRVKGVMDRSVPAPKDAKTYTGPVLDKDSAFLVKTKHEPTPSDAKPEESSKKGPEPSGGKGDTTSLCRSGAECSPTCEEKQARWNRLKDTCEQSSWQAYPCVDFLRKANGCVDASLIKPGPDGDLTCPSQSRATAAQRRRTGWEANCKRRQMFVTPVSGGGAICKRANEPLPVGFDICTDPAAMPGEGQCNEPRGVGGPERPSPTPKPDPRRPSPKSPPG